MNIDNWKEPFKIAFKLGMFSLGWILVLLIASFVLAITVAILKSLPKLFTKKKAQDETDPLNERYQEAMGKLAKTKNFKIVKDED